MDAEERKMLHVVENADRSRLKFAASEAIKHYYLDEFKEHAGMQSQTGTGFVPSVRKVYVVNNTTLEVQFWGKMFVGEAVRPFRIPIRGVCNKLGVMATVSSINS